MSKLTKYHGICEGLNCSQEVRLIFLDIDGVMATDFSAGNRDENHDHMFNPKAVEHLNSIVHKTDCYIVISSSWRKRDLQWIRKVFEERGFKYPDRIVGETMRGYEFVEKAAHLPIPRGVEIKAWIDLFVRKVEGKGFINNAFQYVIIDDDSDMLLEQKDHFVRTDTFKGLTEIESAKVIYIFNN
jgi:hypothetical protein